MARRIVHGALGAALVLAFIGWSFARQWEPVADHIAINTVLGWMAWACSWACLLGGLALLAKAIFRE